MTSPIQFNQPGVAVAEPGPWRPVAAEVLEHFAPLESVRQYPEGVVLFEEGQTPTGLFLLRAGRVKLGVRSRRGSQVLLEVAGAGEMLGLSACVSGRPYELTARTLTPCEAIFVRREVFLSFLRDRPQACVEMVKLLSTDLDTAYERIRHMRRR
jgi:CRP/FNR family transcriptional regulator